MTSLPGAHLLPQALIAVESGTAGRNSPNAGSVIAFGGTLSVCRCVGVTV
jgi:hypothetical protein